MDDFLKDIPNPILRKEPLFGLDFHPSRKLVAYSSAAGSIQVQQYTPNGAHTTLLDLSHHTKSCRSVLFSPKDGANLFSCSSDKSIIGIDLETRKTVFEQKKAHEWYNITQKSPPILQIKKSKEKLTPHCLYASSPINAMYLHENLIFTGDEDGVIKIWDSRKPEKVKEIAENDDYISAFVVSEDRSTLLATSGDQTLTVIDYGSGKALDRSAEQDDELLCLSLIKGGRKVVCGGQSGLLSVFTWDHWMDRSCVCPGHLESVDCMVPVDDQTLITGCGDGIIRIVSILPNKIVGVISAQTEDLPITSLAISHDKTYLAACVDTSVQFWNVSVLFNDDDENEEGDEEEDQVVEQAEDTGAEDFVDGEEDEEDAELDLEAELTPSSDTSSDESESSVSEPEPTMQAPRKRGGKQIDHAKAAFFEDL